MGKNEIKTAYHKVKNIQGWFALEAAFLIGAINQLHLDQDIKGNIFEIGVHHGKSTVFFCHLLRADEQIKVCDIFEAQEENISQSGHGDKDIFLNNIKKYSTTNLEQVFECPSEHLSPSEIGNGFRMFHIDGGHHKSEALNDLLLAAQSIHHKGVIILDDPFMPEWPGVTEALIHFLQDHPHFKAIAMGFNKMLIVKKDVVDDYLSFLDKVENRVKFGIDYPYNYKTLPFVDSNLRIFYLPPNRTSIIFRSSIFKRIIKSKFGTFIKRFI